MNGRKLKVHELADIVKISDDSVLTILHQPYTHKNTFTFTRPGQRIFGPEGKFDRWPALTFTTRIVAILCWIFNNVCIYNNKKAQENLHILLLSCHFCVQYLKVGKYFPLFMIEKQKRQKSAVNCRPLWCSD